MLSPFSGLRLRARAFIPGRSSSADQFINGHNCPQATVTALPDYLFSLHQQLALNREQREALTIYTAMFCVDFIAEFGQRFNQDEAAPVAPERLRRLTSLLNAMLPAHTLGS